MIIARVLGVLVAVACLAACQNDPRQTQASDVVASGLLEASIGEHKTRTIPTAAGTLLGPYSGSAVGRALNETDQRLAEDTARASLQTSPDGQTQQWRNPATGNAGSFKPLNAYRSADNLLCRDYEQTVSAGNQTQPASGTACQEAEGGLWRVLESARRSTGRERTR